MPQTPGGASELNILVVDDEANIRKMLVMCLETDGHRVAAVSNARDAVDEAGRKSFDVVFLDLRLGQDRGLDVIPAILAQSPWTRIIVITAHGTIDLAVEAMKRGAADFLTKPFTPAQVRQVARRVQELRTLELQVAGLKAAIGDGHRPTSLDSASPAMVRATNLARQVAKSDATLLIRGESGTGKGVLARAVHQWSARADKPFATISCPTLSSQLLESELFGHARGAFTGAVRDNPGRIAMSEGGTLFLDEIGELPLELQPKLLRFVQDREYERVGDAATRLADVRVITATNANLEDLVKAGRFREDLLYRINVVQVELPPLRERREDIQPLALRLLVGLHGDKRNINSFSDEASNAMQNYDWPGNVRELRNVIERALILCQGERIGLEQLPDNLKPGLSTSQLGDRITLEQLEELHIRRILASTRSLDEAADVLGIDLATLWRRRKKYGI
ncbi:MAG TPA: sigma-54 dependent transcriptional regulator [Tepidisphaeraceae bacterium]|jgi:NtrC-family two-component system response regulator AlgB